MPRPAGIDRHDGRPADPGTSVFARLVGKAERVAAAKRPAEAAAWAAVAAHRAWMVQPGSLTSPRLDALVQRLGSAVPAPDPTSAGTTDAVVHVVTQLHRTGGHTALIRRWADAQPQRRHVVAVTGQGEAGLPAETVAGDRLGAGQVRRCDTSTDPLLRAAALRAVCQGAGLVVLHPHPYDVVPGLALAGLDDVAVLRVDHADHVAWTGARLAGAVASLRDAGRDVAITARGIPSGGSVLLPLPLAEGPPVSDEERAAAREQAGLPPDALVLLTLAAAYKYGDGRRDVLPGLLAAQCARCPRLHVLAVGPGDGRAWAVARRASGGRIRAFAPTPDVRRFVAAADALLDSAPMGSLTSALDAACAGLPLVRLAWPDQPRVLSSEDPALPGAALDGAAFEQLLDSWLGDVGAVRSAGQLARADVLRLHTGEHWRGAADAAEGAARAGMARGLVPGAALFGPATPPDLVRALARLHVPPAFPGDLTSLIALHREELRVTVPRAALLQLARGAARAGMRSRASVTAPEWLLVGG